MSKSKYNMSSEEKHQLITSLEKRAEYEKYNRFDTFFQDEGEYRRELYPKHLAFFEAGIKHKERAFIASNRCGKTVSGAYEVTCHLTGLYPEWWEGRVFDHPVEVWVVGVSSEECRNVLQKELLGRKQDLGTGMIPKHLIERTTHRSLPPDSIADAYIKHKSGGFSVVEFKASNQGREIFQGTAKHIIWCDEEIGEDIYLECLLRTMTCQGMMILTYTPIKGLSNVTLSFLPNGRFPKNNIVE